MSDDQRVYSDEEFALILRNASDLASRVESSVPRADGLTLAEIKAAAAQVGFDPADVERAARLLFAESAPSPFERMIGGPLRHTHETNIPVNLDEQAAARLLSAVRIGAGQGGNRDEGHSSSLGMTWHDGGEMEPLRVTARNDKDGTSFSVVVDRRGTLATVATASGLAMFFSVLFAGSFLYPESHALGYAGLVTGVGGTLAAARGYWASSTRKVRVRISEVIDTIVHAISQP